MAIVSSGNTRSRLRYDWATLPSLVAAAGCVAVVFGVVRSDQGVSGPSGLKLAALAAILALAGYLLVSAWVVRFRGVNNIVLFNVVAALAGAEVVLRLTASILPVWMVVMLPAADRAELLAERGLYTRETVTGEKMLYHWRPHATVLNLPWVKVDANGFRNPSVPNAVDVVLLGDSITIAQNSHQDMADMLRARGLSVLNFGFGGYGPYHQRDAYRKFVLEAGIRHRAVLVNFCYCNDVTDAQSYRRIESLGGSWRNYLETTPTRMAFPFAFAPPWVVSIAFNLPYVAVQYYRTRPDPADTRFIDLPRGRIDARGWFPNIPPRLLDDADWQPALDALSDIARLTAGAKARLVIAYYPDLLQLYTDGLSAGDPVRTAVERGYADAIARLKDLASRHEAIFTDYTKSLTAAGTTARVTVEDRDYHPNQRGVEIMMEIAYPVLARVLAAVPLVR